MAASPAVLGLFFCFIATVLLVIVSVSAPTWNSVYFLRASFGELSYHFGVFGYTGSQVHVGYHFPSIVASKLSTVHHLTIALILHPIAAGLSGMALLFGLCGAGYHRSGTVLMTLSSSLAAIVTFIAFVLDLVLFSIARHEFRKFDWSSQYGNAIWMTLAALIALLLGFCTAGCGIFGSYRRNRQTTY